MSAQLPDRPSLDYLKKIAKERLTEQRRADSSVRLSAVQFALAREYGFASWRALKAEIDRRRASAVDTFLRACAAGEIDLVRSLLDHDSSLAAARDANGATGLHRAVRHPDVLRLLLSHGADPNARDTGDRASALHIAAAQRRLESVQILLDAGSDPQGEGDLHKGDVIGWAACEGNEAVIALLLARGARHHIFSAIALGDLDLVESVIEDDPEALARRRSRFEQGHTPLHAALGPADGLAGKGNLAMLQRLIELGADLEAVDDRGRTVLDVAMLRGDREAMRLLKAAGAKEHRAPEVVDVAGGLAAAARAVRRTTPMVWVADVRATIAWYESIGFVTTARYEDDGEMTFARLVFGQGDLMFSSGATRSSSGVSLWFYTDDVETLYRVLKARQLRVAEIALAGDAGTLSEPEVRFDEDLYRPFYGGRQFSVRDNNGLSLIFYQEDETPGAGG